MTWITEKTTGSWLLNDSINSVVSTSEKYLNILIEYAKDFFPRLLWAILALWIGFKIIWLLNNVIKRSMEKARIDPMIKAFSLSFISIILKISVFLSAASMLGFQTTSFVALFTAAWVAVGMSLSGTLQNFAWGIIILTFKLYKIWDYISIWWNEWTVKSIRIFHTIILTPDRKTLIVPNSQISNWTMINFSKEKIRRLDVSIWIWYDSDINFVKNIFMKILESDERILKTDDHNINIFVNELRDSAVLITMRFFVQSENLLKVKWEVYEKVLTTCRENNITIPFPTTDIHLYNK